MSTVGGNFIIDAQSPDTFYVFQNKWIAIASPTGRNTNIHYDNNPYGFDLQKNDLYNVNNAVINNMFTITFKMLLLRMCIS